MLGEAAQCIPFSPSRAMSEVEYWRVSVGRYALQYRFGCPWPHIVGLEVPNSSPQLWSLLPGSVSMSRCQWPGNFRLTAFGISVPMMTFGQA